MIKWINDRIPKRLRSVGIIVWALGFIYLIILPFDKFFKREINDNIKMCRCQTINRSRFYLCLLMLIEYAQNQISPFEYRCFDLWQKNKEERDAYMSKEELLQHFKGEGINYLPNDKYQRYLLFKDYFKRDIAFISGENSLADEQTFSAFKRCHTNAIVKPKMGSKGCGVKLINLTHYESAADILRLSQGSCLLEEVIKQNNELGQFHPQSVNTIRYVTSIDSDGRFSFLYTLFRTGCGDSVVDNVGAGGIIALVNETGEVITDGMRSGEYFQRHPDSGIEFKGFKMPEWETLSMIVEKAHRTLPQQKLLGWDFAWSENGWDLVEVNPAPSFASYQTLTNSGVKTILRNAGII